MQAPPSVDQVVELARRLSPLDKLKVIERLAPDLEAALAPDDARDEVQRLDDQYQRGYEQIPEDTADIAALLPHLPIPPENWE